MEKSQRRSHILLCLAALCLSALAPSANAAKKLDYKPNPPLAKKYLIKMKVGVAPFKDETEDFKIKRPEFRVPYFIANMTQYKKRGSIYFTAAHLAEFYFTDLDNSKIFRITEFADKKGMLKHKDLKIQGILKEATYINRNKPKNKEDEIKLHFTLEAIKLPDDKVIWQNEYKLHLKGEWDSPPGYKITKFLKESFEKAHNELILKIHELQAPPKAEDLIDKDESEMGTDDIFNNMQEIVEDAQKE
ncbi:hypothetical protein ACFL6Y_01295 [Elusimicrobiota bacterium]